MIFKHHDALKVWRSVPRDLYHVIKFSPQYGHYAHENVCGSLEEAAAEVLENDDSIAVYKITIDGLRVSDPADVSADVVKHLIETDRDCFVPGFVELHLPGHYEDAEKVGREEDDHVRRWSVRA